LQPTSSASAPATTAPQRANWYKALDPSASRLTRDNAGAALMARTRSR
jgi:hypothetical protein